MDIKEKFKTLLSQNKLQEIIELLSDYKNSALLSEDDLGWVYWNTSDCYALLRDHQALYKNHKEFFTWAQQNLSPDKWPWIVSDSTQALTLSLGNHFDGWIDWYNYICEHAPRRESNRGVRFESHRTLAGSLLVLDQLTEIDRVLDNMKQLIEEDENWSNALFSKITYYKQLLGRLYKSNDSQKIESALQELQYITNSIDFNALDKTQDDLLIGSWGHLNARRNTQRDILVALNNLACTYADVEQYQFGVELFELIQSRGHRLNSYGFSKYVLSVLKSRGANEASRLVQSSNYPLSDLVSHTALLTKLE